MRTVFYSSITLKNAEPSIGMQKKKVLFHQDNAPCHKSIATMAKMHELHFELLPHLKRMLQGKRFGSNEEGDYVDE